MENLNFVKSKLLMNRKSEHPPSLNLFFRQLQNI